MTQYRAWALGAITCLHFAGATAQAADPSSCKLTLRQEIPAEFDGTRLLVWGTVNGVKMRMGISTGGERSMIDPVVAAGMHLPIDHAPHHITDAIGIGGRTSLQRVLVKSVTVGDRVWAKTDLEVAYTMSTSPEPYPRAMVLGDEWRSENNDWMHPADLEIDPAAKVVRLWDTVRCEGDYVNWALPHVVIPLKLSPPSTVLATVTIGSAKWDTVIATGASRSSITTEAAHQAGVTDADLLGDKAGTSRGADGKPVAVRYHVFSDVHIGPAVIPRFGMAVGDVQLVHNDMLLGMDFMYNRHVWISTTTRQMFVTGPVPAP